MRCVLFKKLGNRECQKAKHIFVCNWYINLDTVTNECTSQQKRVQLRFVENYASLIQFKLGMDRRRIVGFEGNVSPYFFSHLMIHLILGIIHVGNFRNKMSCKS